MNYDVILCTKDRPGEVLTFSMSLKSQSVLPLNFIIVDASLNENTLSKALGDIFSDTLVNIIYQTTAPGLTRQRNLGCKYINEDSQIVFFFDDDVILCDNQYIEKVINRYSEDTVNQIGCISGRILTPADSNNEKLTKKDFHFYRLFCISNVFSLISRLFLISSSKVLHVLPSGMNTGNQNKAHEECFVDWQPGCCMSFRKTVLDKYKFDESLTGYSMREDIDISYRVARAYKILYLPNALLLHVESPIARMDGGKFGEANFTSWHWFVKKNMGYFNRVCFYWSAMGSILIMLLRYIVGGEKGMYDHAKGGMRALGQILKGDKLRIGKAQR